MEQQRQEPWFPFNAIVGQNTMKRALLLNTVNPKIGGVLIRGKKGTAKSTAVRSLAALLPEVSVVRGCPYSCPPDYLQGLCQFCDSGQEVVDSLAHQVRIVDLPVGATEDRLVGSLDIEQAIVSGSKSFEPGLIAAAHRGILYIDEVNLLNAKLLFTNKLFRSFGLSNDQKMKVVENFDRAHNLREVKLVYSTLAESFGTKTTKQEIKEHKGSASKAVASTKSKKQEIIAEGSELRDRFKKLAGII